MKGESQLVLKITPVCVCVISQIRYVDVFTQNKNKKIFKSGCKKAIVTLKKGQIIDLATGI